VRACRAAWQCLTPMKKPLRTGTKLRLRPETVKILNGETLKDVAGGAPVTTRDLPCIPPPP